MATTNPTPVAALVQRLKMLAQAATPGPYSHGYVRGVGDEPMVRDEFMEWMLDAWRLGTCDRVYAVNANRLPEHDEPPKEVWEGDTVTVAVTGLGPRSELDAAFFAEATPENILTLCDALERQERELIELRAVKHRAAEVEALRQQSSHIAATNKRLPSAAESYTEAKPNMASDASNSCAWADYQHHHTYRKPCHEAVVVNGKNYAKTYNDCTMIGCDAVLVRCSCGSEYWI